LGLLLSPAIPLSILIRKAILKHLQEKKDKRMHADMLKEAEKLEKSGRFVSAGLIHEKLKNPEKAASLYENGADYARAAVFYEDLGQIKKAGEMYEKAGDPANAADAYLTSGDYLEAARIYNQSGDKLKSAQAFEMSGNRVAAARSYREAKEYVKAAMLLKEEGMLKEAAEMYSISLAGQEPQTSNLDRYFYYASLLQSAQEIERYHEVLKKIAAIDPDYRDVSEKLKAAGISAADKKVHTRDMNIREPATEKVIQTSSIIRGTTLRSLMQSGRMEPRYSLRLWVQVLKSLGKRHKEGLLPETLTPESISIDSSNNVDFSATSPKDFAYMAPETVAGARIDQVAMIYSVGIILFEMLTGSLDPFGIKKPGEVMGDVPPWLEEIAMNCIEKDRDSRYQSFDDIFSTLKSIKNKM
jgi:tetratricopeptide (TPR) repeat protein